MSRSWCLVTLLGPGDDEVILKIRGGLKARKRRSPKKAVTWDRVLSAWVKSILTTLTKRWRIMTWQET